MKVIETAHGVDKTSQHQDWAKQKINIASVVHDEICPTLTFLLHDMYWIEKISESSTVKTRANHCIDQLTNAMNKCRNVLLDLSPEEEGPSLTESLNGLISNFKINSGFEVTADIGDGINQLGIEQQSVVYRSVQEALTNVSKHAHAKRVTVTAKTMLNQMHVQVVDDGIGLAQGHVPPKFCYGLRIQKHRTQALGGHFSVERNSNGQGTNVHLTFPLHPALGD